MSTPKHPTAPIPFLYIPDHGPSNPVLLSGGRGIQFVFDRDLNLHVKRFESLEQFAKEAPEIIKDETMWKIFPGVEIPAALPDEAAPNPLDGVVAELKLCLDACLHIAKGTAPKLDEYADHIRNAPAVAAVIAIAGTKPVYVVEDVVALPLLEKIAFLCHEANRAYCMTLGDYSVKGWFAADPSQRESVIRGVEFRLGNPFVPPSAQHEAWMDDKLKDGWVYGPVKDMEKKEHPCMVAYAELPAEQQIKDLLFASVVNAMISHSDREALGSPAGNTLAIPGNLGPEGAGNIEAEVSKFQAAAGLDRNPPTNEPPMTATEAAQTLANRIPEPEDKQAGQVLSKKARKKKEKEDREAAAKAAAAAPVIPTTDPTPVPDQDPSPSPDRAPTEEEPK